MLDNLKNKLRKFFNEISSNGQFSRGKGKYVFDSNKGAYPGSFVPIESVKGPLEPKDIILTYTPFPRGTLRQGFRIELEQFRKPIKEIYDDMYFDGRSNKDYYNAVNEMRRIAGDHVVD